MSTYTLDLKLAAPVVCLDCDWLGRTGELINKRQTLVCPKCDGNSIKWIESPAPEALQ